MDNTVHSNKGWINSKPRIVLLLVGICGLILAGTASAGGHRGGHSSGKSGGYYSNHSGYATQPAYRGRYQSNYRGSHKGAYRSGYKRYPKANYKKHGYYSGGYAQVAYRPVPAPVYRPTYYRYGPRVWFGGHRHYHFGSYCPGYGAAYPAYSAYAPASVYPGPGYASVGYQNGNYSIGFGFRFW